MRAGQGFAAEPANWGGAKPSKREGVRGDPKLGNGEERRKSIENMKLLAHVILWASILVPGTALPAGESEVPGSDSDPAEAESGIRGVVISTHGIGHDWGSDAIVPCFEDVASLGANWVSTHPYASIRKDGSVRYHYSDSEESPAHWLRPIEEAHALGLKIFVKPHIAYWGSGFNWRGEIRFDRPEHWERFFREYRKWILHLAEVCREADGFAVGTELDQTLDHVEEWRELIGEVRLRTGAALTYAANWTDYRRVDFWQELDVIGIQAYFPLSEAPNPSVEQIRDGWSSVLRELGAYSRKQNRKIVFTEAGYSQSRHASVRPWEGGVEGEEGNACQEACFRILFEEVPKESSVVGLFLWKWFPPPHSAGRNYRLATPRLKSLIRSYWRSEGLGFEK